MRRKTSRSRVQNQQTQPTYEASLEIELGPHWWEASVLISAPILLSISANWN